MEQNGTRNGLSKADLWDSILSWSIMHREALYTPEQLKLIGREYYSALSAMRITQKQFDYAKKYVLLNCKFFPKIPDIVSGVMEYRKNPPEEKKAKQIEASTSYHDPTPEEIELNKKRLKIIAQVIAKKITAEDGEKIQEKLIQDRYEHTRHAR